MYQALMAQQWMTVSLFLVAAPITSRGRGGGAGRALPRLRLTQNYGCCNPVRDQLLWGLCEGRIVAVGLLQGKPI